MVAVEAVQVQAQEILGIRVVAVAEVQEFQAQLAEMAATVEELAVPALHLSTAPQVWAEKAALEVRAQQAEVYPQFSAATTVEVETELVELLQQVLTAKTVL